eukprot:CAMPEP_0184865204 /NCGR_PEP_ID=MMETSP0580-20130426/17312_1 /TAXON_ID=1118495 /ORGANISM="Dactyliosolen fragilissimus" /LENGTH=342 /DNA_ID=CAMNT_0027364301 /DNA_START=50 /DNA_END=1078 /DNA_ORIENTATION=+
MTSLILYLLFIYHIYAVSSFQQVAPRIKKISRSCEKLSIPNSWNNRYMSSKRRSFPIPHASQNNNKGEKRGASVSISGVPSIPLSSKDFTVTLAIDYLLTLITSDIGSVVIGLIGLFICLYNRLSAIDFDNSAIASNAADAMGQQSRYDLLAVFASGAVLLNGISKLDVTSALAESVELEGIQLPSPTFVNQDGTGISENYEIIWSVKSALVSTPAKSAYVLVRKGDRWFPSVCGGIVPSDENKRVMIPKDRSTPILDKFTKQKNSKETYLPTLQALPGKVEFTYLPQNTQEAILLPISSFNDDCKVVLVLGSDTAKTFTPRDVAWCQVLVKRMRNDMTITP